MILKAVSPLKKREFPSSKDGQMITIYWVELKLSDGIDTMIAELVVPATRDEKGEMVHRQPELPLEVAYSVAAEIDGASGVTDKGVEWSRNRINIRKMVKL